MNSQFLRVISVFAFLSCLLCATGADADLIRYTIEGNGDGSFAGQSFSNTDFAIVAFADTDDVTPFSFGFYVANASTNVSVAGMSNGNFTNEIWTVVNQANEIAGFGDQIQDLAILGVGNPIFANYDLQSWIGPITGASTFNQGNLFPTTAGDFVLNQVNNASFSAQVIPEPATGTLLMVCVAGFVARRRRTS